MTPDSACGSCRHSLKFHNPCSKCECQAFVPSDRALGTPGSVANLPMGSATRHLIDAGKITESGLIVPKGADS